MYSADDTTSRGRGVKTHKKKKPSPKKNHLTKNPTLREQQVEHNSRYLFLEQQSHPFKELVAINGGEGDVEEKAKKDGLWDPLEREREEQQREPHQEICHQTRQPGLLHAHDPGSRKREVRR